MVKHPLFPHNHPENEFEEPMANFAKDMKEFSKTGLATCKAIHNRVVSLGYVNRMYYKNNMFCKRNIAIQ